MNASYGAAKDSYLINNAFILKPQKRISESLKKMFQKEVKSNVLKTHQFHYIFLAMQHRERVLRYTVKHLIKVFY